MNLPCPVLALIPQQGKMGFDQLLLKTENDAGESQVVIQKDNFFLDDRGQLSNTALIEYVNQLNAAVSGYNDRHHGKPAKKGLFVGLQDAEFLRPVHVGDTLKIEAVKQEEVAQVNFVQGVIYRGAVKIAQVMTKLYEAKDPSEFDAIANPARILKSRTKGKRAQAPAYIDSNLQRLLFEHSWGIAPAESTISLCFSLPEESAVFDGHFPGNPILPGVILLEIGMLAMGLIVKKTVRLQSIKKMKISSVVVPEQTVSVTAGIERLDGCPASFSAVLAAEDGREISRFQGSLEDM
ncbi:MAG: hypothetical protein ACM3X6_04295 [Patescibacteria group bacterium]